jgi:hypothetical protein
MNAPRKFLIVSAFSLAAASLSFAAEAPAFRFPSEIERPLSVFDDKAASPIRDPFFPKSTRPPYFQPKEVPGSKEAAARVPEIKLTLKSIIVGSGGKNLAMINNQTFQEGESGMVRLPSGGQVRVRCVKINDRSVTVAIEGKNDQTELRLQEK